MLEDLQFGFSYAALIAILSTVSIAMHLDEVLNTVHWIQWRSIFILTIVLIAIHVLFLRVGEFGDLGVANDNLSTKPPNAAPALTAASVPSYGFDAAIPLIVDGPDGYDYPPDAAPNPYIAICMAIKDQAPDLGEFFVHHYHHMGIRSFYIMDDGSEPPLSSFDYPGVPRSALTFELQDGAARASGGYQQNAIYARCMQQYGSLHTWMAFLDGDEYIEIVSNETLHGILAEFEADKTIGALAINWRMHSSSGLLKRPESARKSFVECVWDDPDNHGKFSHNRHVKVIVRTKLARKPRGPHMWYLKNAYTVGEHGDKVNSEAFRRPITRDRIALHHYVVKSREEFEEKMHRGNGMDDPKREAFWDDIENKQPKVSCPEMARYNP